MVKYKDILWNGNPVPVADWTGLSHSEWEQFRSSLSKIGGSDLGTICGYNKYKDPIVLFWEKVGVKKKMFVDNEFTASGHMDEPVILRRLEYYDGASWHENFRAGKKFRRIETPDYTYLPQHMPWMAANIDGVIYEDHQFPELGMGVAEFKKISGQYSDLFVGGVPPQYFPQVVSYMESVGAEYGRIALLKDGSELMVRTLLRGTEEYNKWAEKVHHLGALFYEAVQYGIRAIAPYEGNIDAQIDALFEIEDHYSEVLAVSSSDVLASWYTEVAKMRENTVVVELDSELGSLARRQVELAATVKGLSEEKVLVENQIRHYMLERKAHVASGDGLRVSFKKSLRVTQKNLQ